MQVRSERGPLSIALAGMLALASGMGIGRFVYTPILPAMIEALGLRPSEAGLIASANFVGYLVGAVLLTRPNHLPGDRRMWFLGALVAGAASMMAMAAATTLPAFAALRFAGGLSSAFMLVLGSALVQERLAAAKAGRLIALHFAGIGVGIAASAILVAGLQAAGFGWRSLWLGAGILSGSLVPIVAALLGRPSPTATVTVPPPIRPSRRGRGLVVLALTYGLFGFGYVITATFLVAAVRASPSARPVEPLIWLAVGLAAIPSTAGWLWLASRIGSRMTLCLAFLTEAAGVAAGGAWPGATGALIAAALLGLTFVSITALGLGAARDIAPPGGLARAFAILTTAFSIGQVAGPLAAGFLLDWTGSFLLPSMLAAAALTLGAILAVLPRGPAPA